eukprot:1191381-Amphidinium_carterae.1
MDKATRKSESTIAAKASVLETLFQLYCHECRGEPLRSRSVLVRTRPGKCEPASEPTTCTLMVTFVAAEHSSSIDLDPSIGGTIAAHRLFTSSSKCFMVSRLSTPDKLHVL